MFIRLALLAFVLSCCKAETVVLNQLMDQVLDSLRDVIHQEGMNHIPTPDAHYRWDYKWRFVQFTAHINCKHGTARALSTIKRTGDATITSSDDRATVQVKLGLSELGFYFGSCQFEAKHLFSFTHYIKGTIGTNSIDLQISLTGRGEQCVAGVDHVLLDQFGDVKVETGGGPLHRIEDRLIEWLSAYFHHEIVNKVNQALADFSAKALPNIDLCNKIPH